MVSALTTTEALVLGAGPAGLSLAAELALRGVEVTVVERDLERVWPNSYGTWASALPPGLVDDAIVGRFVRPLVTFADGERQPLSTEYVRFDTRRLQASLHQRAARAGVRFLASHFEGAREDRGARLADVRTQEGEGKSQLRARVIVDCRGRVPDQQRAPAFQSAFGAWFEVSEMPFAPGEMSLMDLRSAPNAKEDGSRSSSFLYAMPEGPGVLFAQETVLASRHAVPPHVLEARLHARLRALDIRTQHEVATEHCSIPLGIAPTSRSSQALAFGAAAGMIQPASGYSLARSLRLASTLAAALTAALRAGGTDSMALVKAGLQAVWPSDARRAFSFYRLGLETLLDWGDDASDAFWRSFFRLPPEMASSFMDGGLGARGVARAMGHVFLHMPLRLRFALIRSGTRFITQPASRGVP